MIMANAYLFEEQLAALANHWVSLPDKPEETPESTLRALWFAAAGSPRALTRVHEPLPVLDPRAARRLRGLVRERNSGVPLAHLTGRQGFMGCEMLSSPTALIPRQETELLAAAAIERARAIARERGTVTVLDVCTGSGNVALAIAAAVPEARVFGGDISEAAVDLARGNALHLGLADRVTFEAGDLFAPFDSEPFIGSVDVVACNPPYISSARVSRMPREISTYEPRQAFDGGTFGIDVVFRLISSAPRFLRDGSCLCLEVGLGQGRAVATRIERNGSYRNVQPITNARGDVRVIASHCGRAARPDA